jgi:hypothetical protein
MAGAGWMVPAAMSIFGGLQGMKAGKEQKKLAKEQILMAEQNAVLAQRELDEQVRRTELENKRIRSSAKARAAASGARLEGTPMEYLDYMEGEQERQLDWMKTAGASRIRLDLQGEKSRAKALKIQGQNQRTSSFFSGVTGAFSYLDKGGYFNQ